jgi:hypothetical protein
LLLAVFAFEFQRRLVAFLKSGWASSLVSLNQGRAAWRPGGVVRPCKKLDIAASIQPSGSEVYVGALKATRAMIRVSILLRLLAGLLAAVAIHSSSVHRYSHHHQSPRGWLLSKSINA